MTATKNRRTFVKLAASIAAVGAVTARGGGEALAWPGGQPSHFVLVHGAWHGAWCWYKVKTLLEAAGQQVTVIDLPAHGVDQTPPGEVTLDAYRDRVVQVLDAQSAPVVLVGHSMGGIAISAAAEVRPAKVARLAYVSAFLLQNGQKMLDVALNDLDSLVVPSVQFQPPVADIKREAVREIFYAECSDADVTLASALLRPTPMAPLDQALTVSAANFGSVRRFYLSCTQDRAITPAAQ
ncbi:MAG: alpha/beta fold hydrolase, partial [Myxococcales bacterium]